MDERTMRMLNRLNRRMNRQRSLSQSNPQRVTSRAGVLRPAKQVNREEISPFELEKRLLNARLGNLMPGNVGDINKIVWPFWFTFNAPVLSPGTSSTATFTVSQEAAFIWMSFSKAVFLRTGTAPNWTYTAIDPNDESAAGDADGLNVIFRDSQSSRTFQRNPMPLDAYGLPEFPTVLNTPLMFLPNSTVEAQYSNTNNTNTYVPWITFFGYRVRIEDAHEILSLVTG
jgi:hypothetical protein